MVTIQLLAFGETLKSRSQKTLNVERALIFVPAEGQEISRAMGHNQMISQCFQPHILPQSRVLAGTRIKAVERHIGGRIRKDFLFDGQAYPPTYEQHQAKNHRQAG